MSIDMNEFGGADNVDALNVLIGEVTDGEGVPVADDAPAVMAEEAPVVVDEQPVVEEAEAPEVPAPTAPKAEPGVDTAAILAQMQAQQEALLNMQAQMQQQNAPEEPQMSEEEQALVELKRRMGVDQLEQQNKQLQQIIQQQQAQAYQKQIESDINALKAELAGFNPDLVAKELHAMANEPYLLPNGQPAMDADGNVISKAQAMDNKAGWAQIWNEKFAQQAAPSPDPIVPVGAGQGSATSKKSAMDRLKEADSTMAQGQAILDLIGG